MQSNKKYVNVNAKIFNFQFFCSLEKICIASFCLRMHYLILFCKTTQHYHFACQLNWLIHIKHFKLGFVWVDKKHQSKNGHSFYHLSWVVWYNPVSYTQVASFWEALTWVLLLMFKRMELICLLTDVHLQSKMQATLFKVI